MLFIGGQQETKIVNKELYQTSKDLFTVRKMYVWNDLIERGFKPTAWNVGEHSTVISFKAINTLEDRQAAERDLKEFKEGYILTVRAEDPAKKIIKELQKVTPASEALIRVYESDIKKELKEGKTPEQVLQRYSKHINDMFRAS